jgi:hypothetical protein
MSRKQPGVRYRKTPVSLWGESWFRSLSQPKPNGQSLYLYLISGPHTTSLPGLFSAGEAALAEALRWPVSGFRRAFQELEVVGKARADWEARVVWLPLVLEDNKPESPNVVQSWTSHVEMIPECGLKHEAVEHLRAFIEGLGEAFVEGFRKGLVKGLGESGAVAVAVTGTGTENGRPGKPDDRATSATSSVDAEQKRSDTVTDTKAGLALKVFEAYTVGYRGLYGKDPAPIERKDIFHLCRHIDHYGLPTMLELLECFFKSKATEKFTGQFFAEHGHALNIFYASISSLVAIRAGKTK